MKTIPLILFLIISSHLSAQKYEVMNIIEDIILNYSSDDCSFELSFPSPFPKEEYFVQNTRDREKNLLRKFNNYDSDPIPYRDRLAIINEITQQLSRILVSPIHVFENRHYAFYELEGNEVLQVHILENISTVIAHISPTDGQNALDCCYVNNSSFEGIPRYGVDAEVMNRFDLLQRWYDCGSEQFENTSAHDVHGSNTGIWDVTHLPSDGFSFVSLVMREDNTYESISNFLYDPIQKDSCYSFTIDLAKSEFYKSATSNNPKPQPFTHPTSLQISLGNSFCEEGQIIGTSPLINHNDWQSYIIEFMADDKYNFINISITPPKNNYTRNSHVLIDNIDNFSETHCYNH